VTSALRTSGLWADLAPEDGWALILLSTFLSPNGDVRATSDQMGHALAVPAREARRRLDRLAALRWHGLPVVMTLPKDPAPETLVLSPPLLGYEEDPSPPPPDNTLPFVPAGRDAVIANSRERYARPKDDVERAIARENGWEPVRTEASVQEPEVSTPSRDAVRRLVSLGFEKARADDLVARFGGERVHRQADWLPYRNVRDPVRFLTAAIAGDYEAPRGPRAIRDRGEARTNTGKADS
jgi:hypothetical protein